VWRITIARRRSYAGVLRLKILPAPKTGPGGDVLVSVQAVTVKRADLLQGYDWCRRHQVVWGLRQ